MTTYYTLTGKLSDLIGGALKSPTVRIGTNLGSLGLHDIDNDKVIPPGPMRVTVANGEFTISLIATNSTGINVPDNILRYIVYVDYYDSSGGKRTWNSGQFELTADSTLAEVAGSDASGVTVDEAAVLIAGMVQSAVQAAVDGAVIELNDLNEASLGAKSNRVMSKRTVTASTTVTAADTLDVVLHSTSATAVTITWPADSAADISQEVTIPWRAYGAGQITHAAGAGATVVSRGSAFKSAGQYAEGIATKVAPNTWLISGDLTA